MQSRFMCLGPVVGRFDSDVSEVRLDRYKGQSIRLEGSELEADEGWSTIVKTGGRQHFQVIFFMTLCKPPTDKRIPLFLFSISQLR